MNSALFDHDAERAVIGALMQDRDCAQFLGVLTPEDFHDPAHQAIFKAMYALHARRMEIDLVTLSSELAADETLALAGGAPYLMEAYRYVPSTVNTGAYVRLVAACSRRRTLHNMLRLQCERLLSGMNDVDEVVDAVRAGLRGGRASGKLLSIGEALAQAFDGAERAAKGDTDAIATGITDLDWLTGGLYPGEMTILGARPGVGKSSLALEIALNAAGAGHRVLVDTLEMTAKQYGQRIIARGSGVLLNQIRHGKIDTDAQWAALAESANEGSRLPVHFTLDVRTPEELRALVEATSPELVVVDYLQLMETRRRTENETVRLGRISVALKELSRECNVPVLALAQVTRTEGRAMVMPILKELRGSGSMEQDADNVWFLHQPEAASDPYIRREDEGLYRLLAGQPNRRYMAVNVAKQRQGELGAFPLIFEPPCMRFTGVRSTAS